MLFRTIAQAAWPYRPKFPHPGDISGLDLFASATRDDFDAQHSDLDFLVEFENFEPTQYAQAYFALKEGLECLFGRPVDLVTGNNLSNPYFRQRVQSERQNLHAR